MRKRRCREAARERAFEHGGQGLSEMADWLLSFAAGKAEQVGVAIETPRGPVVESPMERGFAVHAINPKQLDRFRDRISPAGAKYHRGRGGLQQDHREALRLFRLAVEQGLASAQVNLGIMYESGLNVQQDVEEAIRLYRLAAEQGTPAGSGDLRASSEKEVGDPGGTRTRRVWMKQWQWWPLPLRIVIGYGRRERRRHPAGGSPARGIDGPPRQRYGAGAGGDHRV